MSEWQPIATAPNDDDFRFYGLNVTNKTGFSWFEAYYLAWDGDGVMIHPSGDPFDDWAFSDFEFWAPAPQTPLENNRTGEASAEEDIVNIKSSDPGTVAHSSTDRGTP